MCCSCPSITLHFCRLSRPTACGKWLELQVWELPAQEACLRAHLQKRAQQGRNESDTLWLLSASSCHLGPTQFLSGHHQLIVVMLLSCTVQSLSSQAQLYWEAEEFCPLCWYQLEEFVLLVPSHEAMQTPGSNWAAAVFRRDLCLSPLPVPWPCWAGTERGSAHGMGLTGSLLLLPSAARCTQHNTGLHSWLLVTRPSSGANQAVPNDAITVKETAGAFE